MCGKQAFPRASKKPLIYAISGVRNKCLAVTYFHMGIHTIIGAESFHGPVRDGKAWDQLAMAARRKLYKSGKPLGKNSSPYYSINCDVYRLQG